MAERVLTGVAPGSLAAAARPDRRQLGVDAMRGLAALCVVVYHGTPHGPGANYVVPYEGTLLQCLDFGVLVFFVISGLLVGGPFVRAVVDGRRMPSVRDFAVRRGARIFPAYWVALAAVILIGGTASVGDVLLHGSLLQNTVPGEQGRLLYQSWTLEIELFFYASVALTAFLVVHRLRRQVSPDVLAAAVVAVWVLSLAVTVAADLVLSVDSRWASVAKYTFPAQVGYICPGVLLAIAGTEAARRRGGVWRLVDRVTASPRLALLVICGFGAVGGLMTARFEVMPRDLHRHAFALSAAVLVATVARHERAVRRYVRWVAPLGVVAYSLYLWHAVVLMAAKRAGIYPLDLRGWHLGVVAQPVSLVLLVAASIAAAAVSYALVERPALRWSVHRSPDGGILGAQPATVAPPPVEAPAPVG